MRHGINYRDRAVQAITHARQSHVGLYQENIRNGFRFLGYGLQEENETYGPGGRINGILRKRGDMVDVYVYLKAPHQNSSLCCKRLNAKPCMPNVYV